MYFRISHLSRLFKYKPKNRIAELLNKKYCNLLEKAEKDDYIELPIIGGSRPKGKLGIVYSAYHIEREEIIALKVSNNDKLTEREIRNYRSISHPKILCR